MDQKKDTQDQNKIEENHPSYGMISFSRCQGNPGRLFGSSLEAHQSYISLSIKTATRIHENGYDRYYSTFRGDIVQLDLSAAQFAELITTLNVGLGVPCTLRYINKTKVEPPPDVEIEAEKIRSSFKEDVERHTQILKQEIIGLKDLLEKKTLTKQDRATIFKKFKDLINKWDDSAPFMLSQFEEATDRVVQQAKSEIDAFVTNNIMLEGLKAIESNLLVKQLQASTETEENE